MDSGQQPSQSLWLIILFAKFILSVMLLVVRGTETQLCPEPQGGLIMF